MAAGGPAGNGYYQEISTTALDDSELSTSVFYNMSHPKRGTAIILNHKFFATQGLETREGSTVDRKKLKKNFKKLGFDVQVHNDLTYGEIMKVIEEAVATDHSECDAFMMAVLTHGGEGCLYASDVPYQTEILWSSFSEENCPSLAGKPKIFFIQACQGQRLDSGVCFFKTRVDGRVDGYSFLHPDFLIAFSTIPGFYSWRNKKKGSWFIQSLCSKLKAHGTKLHMLTILTLVSQRVAIEYESDCPNDSVFQNKKQVPCIVTMLTKLLKFSKKNK